MGNLLVQSRELSDIVHSAMQPPSHDETYRVIDRLLPSAADQNIPISLILFQIQPFAKIFDTLDEKTIRKIIGGFLAILMEQTPDLVYLDCAERNEFIVLIPTAETEQAMKAGEEISRRFEGMVKSITGRKRIPIKLFGGVSNFPHDADNRLDLFRCARSALYKASQDDTSNIMTVQKEKMHTKSVSYASDQMEFLKKITALEGTTEAAICREALDCYRKRYMD